ncbi:inositol monophosphatase [Hydrogenovibrio sp. SC-1]|uniref:inositol monophosphatase family protein n=1 Tax=Hydrogenovibrio sp. SC-1 TaxID=2065820 RepID=UPI000C7B563A|nr:inositol monophosphatase [Hydrogenovibrio sp. SC-1]PLA73731.1 inositol monophosphatase [Hydrogenovibrio sp. SC-1]
MSIFADSKHWQTLKQGIIQLAKQEVLSRFEKISAERKADGSLLTEADTEMQKATQVFLQQHWPQFDFLGEESSEQVQKDALQSPKGCWILDPVDGTSNFASGIPFFSVSLALVIQGKVAAGIIYDPVREELFAARQELGAELNDQPLVASCWQTSLKQCIGIVDFKRLELPLAQKLIAQAPYASQRSIGSVALDWCWVAAGRGQVYCHGAQNIWDYAAGWLILEEAGGQSATLDGEAVFCSEITKRSAVAATTPSLFKAWQQHLKV